jgi:PKD repeat protein
MEYLLWSFYRLCFLLLAFFALIPTVFAQCPVASNCTPGTAPASSFPFGMGIYNVTVGAGTTGFVNPTTSGVQAGYQDYSCAKKATVLEGVATTISVTTNPNVNENVRVWVDLNNDGNLAATSELVFSSVNAKTHSGTFTIPVSASVVKNAVLRMRVSAENFSAPIPSPCTTPAYSQVEDYGVTVLPNTSKPLVDFSANHQITCSPTVQFTNQIQGGSTSYFWDFGDGATSMAGNPSHTYAATGTYTVKLKACNANGCDSLTKTNYLTYHTNVPVPASCSPTTTNYCCGFGITKVTFHTMVNTSQDGRAGYEDFTCTKSVTLEEGKRYPIFIETDTANNQDTWVYIDFNNNGIFEPAELALTRLNTKNPVGMINFPISTITNTPLRLRIISDHVGSSSNPCFNRTSGQVEDYTIILTTPKVSFNSNFTSMCTSQVQFNGSSLTPALSWFWDLGDNTTSTLQNPSHNYTTNGIYSVKLKVCDAITCDSIIKENYIVINKPCPTAYCTNRQATNNTVSILSVKLNTLDNNTIAEPNGYGNYTYLGTSVTTGGYYQLAVRSHENTGGTVRTIVWIDYNKDGDFTDTGEEIANDLTTDLKKNILISPIAYTGITRMRVLSQDHTEFLRVCPHDSVNGEIEDYSLEIKPVTSKPITNFSVKTNACNGLNVLFADSSHYFPNSYSWDFGDPSSGAANTSVARNPNHSYAVAGTYTVKYKVCSSFGCDSLQKTVTVAATTAAAPAINLCVPNNSRFPKALYGIEKVNLNSINNITTGFANGYKDYTCTQRTNLEINNTYTITVQTALAPSNPANRIYELAQAWIDFNNNGILDDPGELVLNNHSIRVHTASFTVPAGAAINQPLRMRVSSKFSKLWNFTTPNYCTLPDSGEVEDYTVTIVPFSNRPIIGFNQDSRIACGSPVQFTDTSKYSPTTWYWDFGDLASGVSNSSTLQNPMHNFSSPGNYTVSLTACNGNGCNTITKTNWISVPANITMVPPVCKPLTTAFCCGAGIRNVDFWTIGPGITGTGIHHASGNASEGYQDYSCTAYGTVVAGYDCGLSVSHYRMGDQVRAWLDYNNDGSFTSNEEINLGFGQNYKIPLTAVRGVYLRLRVMSDAPNSPIQGPCSNLQSGQTEDYAVKIISPPIAGFTRNYDCNGTIAFTDTSLSNPTSWEWYFNDPASGTNNISNLQNPTHTFSGPGNYWMSLKACNAHGCHTTYKNVVIGINPGISLIPSACNPRSLYGYITNVTFASINNTTSTNSRDWGYQDYTCSSNTIVTPGRSYPISIQTDGSTNARIWIWIDFNNDGTFSQSESVFNSTSQQNHSGTITIPATGIKNTYLRMRVTAIPASYPLPQPCSPFQIGQTEDYAVMISTQTGLAENLLASKIKLYPNPNNGTFSIEIPTVLKSDYHLEAQELTGKTVATQTLKVMDGQIQPIDLSRLAKGVYLVRIFNADISVVKKVIIE